MSKDEIALINQLLGEISELRGEMKEFKEQTMTRLDRTEDRCDRHQRDPKSCVVGRSLEEHKEDHRQGKEGGKSTLMVVTEGLTLVGMILIALFV